MGVIFLNYFKLLLSQSFNSLCFLSNALLWDKLFAFILVYEITESKFLFCLISVSIVMGIPTVKRKVKSYLTETLHSLIDKLSPEEKLDCVMVVFIGEVIT